MPTPAELSRHLRLVRASMQASSILTRKTPSLQMAKEHSPLYTRIRQINSRSWTMFPRDSAREPWPWIRKPTTSFSSPDREARGRGERRQEETHSLSSSSASNSDNREVLQCRFYSLL